MSLDAFVVDEADRDRLASKFPPKFADFIGHHVTHQFGVKPNTDANHEFMYGEEVVVHLVGYAHNDAGLEAFVVDVGGTTNRPDGKTYHLTWSLNRAAGFKPVDSGDLVRMVTIKAIKPPIPITTTFLYI